MFPQWGRFNGFDAICIWLNGYFVRILTFLAVEYWYKGCDREEGVDYVPGPLYVRIDGALL